MQCHSTARRASFAGGFKPVFFLHPRDCPAPSPPVPIQEKPACDKGASLQQTSDFEDCSTPQKTNFIFYSEFIPRDSSRCRRCSLYCDTETVNFSLCELFLRHFDVFTGWLVTSQPSLSSLIFITNRDRIHRRQDPPEIRQLLEDRASSVGPLLLPQPHARG